MIVELGYITAIAGVFAVMAAVADYGPATVDFFRRRSADGRHRRNNQR